MRTSVRAAGDDESQVSAGAPVLAGIPGSDLTEEIKETASVWREERGLLLGDAACGIGGVMAQHWVAGEECAQERPEQCWFGEDLRGGAACVGETPGWNVEMQRVGVGLVHAPVVSSAV